MHRGADISFLIVQFAAAPGKGYDTKAAEWRAKSAGGGPDDEAAEPALSSLSDLRCTSPTRRSVGACTAPLN